MCNSISKGNMFHPKTLQCYAAQVIVDGEIPTNEIPMHLQEHMSKLKELKELKEEEEYLVQKLDVLEANMDDCEFEADLFDSLAQDVLPDQDLAKKYLEDRDIHDELYMKLELWMEKTKAELSSRDRTEESLLLPEEYKNITFNVDVEYEMDDDVDIVIIQ